VAVGARVDRLFLLDVDGRRVADVAAQQAVRRRLAAARRLRRVRGELGQDGLAVLQLPPSRNFAF
jgi:hypothetical protein